MYQDEPQINDGGYLGDSNITNSSLLNALLSSQQDSQPSSAPLTSNNKTTSNSTSFFSKLDVYYDLPLAYIIVIILCYLYTLIAIVKAVAHEFKDRLVEGEGQFYQYCNLVFGGWDFCIHNEKSAQIKYKVNK